MTQAREPDEPDFARSLRRLDRRVSRLEDTQVTWRELDDSFNRIYDEIDALEAQMNSRFDRLENSVNQKLDEQNRKIDIILRHITGEGNT